MTTSKKIGLHLILVSILGISFSGCAAMNTPEFAEAMRNLNQQQVQYNQQYDTDRQLRNLNNNISNLNSTSKLRPIYY